jgi:Ca2+-binding EF-hand superfamily protein
MKLTIIPAAVITLFATAAIAAAPTFQEADANADGWVTPDELAAVMPEATESDFVAIDTNGDGAISEAEMAAYVATQPSNG